MSGPTEVSTTSTGTCPHALGLADIRAKVSTVHRRYARRRQIKQFLPSTPDPKRQYCSRLLLLALVEDLGPAELRHLLIIIMLQPTHHWERVDRSSEVITGGGRVLVLHSRSPAAIRSGPMWAAVAITLSSEIRWKSCQSVIQRNSASPPLDSASCTCAAPS
jgi:hypothetical protein